jgi:hypothetical protein
MLYQSIQGKENKEMFTNKTSRREQPGDSRNKYIEPFDEDDTDESGKNSTRSSGGGNGYMAELEAWLDEAVFEPIESAIANEDSKELHLAFSESKQLIKRKVLASYHNGLKAKSPIINNPKNNGQQTYRRN